jgi:hypothetical protein
MTSDRDRIEHANVCSLPFGHQGGHWWDETQACRACGGRGGFAASGETCSDCLGTGSESDAVWGTYYPDPYNPNEAQP